MNPEQAKDVIEKLIEEHGPTCAAANHMLVMRGSTPMIVDKETWHMNDIEVCKVGKSGMKNGFAAGLWNDMGEMLARAVNEAERKG